MIREFGVDKCRSGALAEIRAGERSEGDIGHFTQRPADLVRNSLAQSRVQGRIQPWPRNLYHQGSEDAELGTSQSP
jgi:hypothetical protein